MAYFNELPNLQVVSRFPNRSSNEDYITMKNLWRRAKLRDDILNAITAFNYYQIEGDERPDQVAQKIYGDSELDWVILITNNITNLNDQWPLNNDTLYKYLIDKYGSEEELQKIHHTETLESRDRYNRLVIPKGLQVDASKNIPSDIKTLPNKEEYELDGFPSNDGLSSIQVNLIQVLRVLSRSRTEILNLITDIDLEKSTLKLKTRDNKTLNININNNLADNWPSSWGGILQISGREGAININVDDIISETVSIEISNRLYEITGELVNDEIIPIFRFRYIPPS